MARDSPLSIAASVIGILTFAIAILLGIYARAIQLSQSIEQLNKLDIEIGEAAATALQSLLETSNSEKDGLNDSNSEPENVLRLLIRMYALDVSIITYAMWIMRQSTFVKITDWDKAKAGMIKDRAEVAGLRTQRQTTLLHFFISRKIDQVEEKLQQRSAESSMRLEQVEMLLKSEFVKSSMRLDRVEMLLESGFVKSSMRLENISEMIPAPSLPHPSADATTDSISDGLSNDSLQDEPHTNAHGIGDDLKNDSLQDEPPESSTEDKLHSEPKTRTLPMDTTQLELYTRELVSPTPPPRSTISSPFSRAMSELDEGIKEKLHALGISPIPTEIDGFLMVAYQELLRSLTTSGRTGLYFSFFPAWLSDFFSGRGPMMACLGFVVGCWTARRRRRREEPPMYGTGWMAGQPGQHSPV